VELEIVRGAAQVRRRAVRPPVYMIGSAADCDLVLGDPVFPELHSYLLVAPHGVTARRIGVGPRLVHNGLETEFARCADGDLLAMGPYEFRLHVAGDFPDGTLADPPLLRAFAAHSGEVDPAWEEAQLLLCDLPAPLRLLAVPACLPRRASA
jgi:hypothetical protein